MIGCPGFSGRGIPDRMILERWQQVLKDGGDRPAVLWDGGWMSFSALNDAARTMGKGHGVLVARGDPPDSVVALLAGFLSGRPVQLVEKDREPREPACPVPEAACLIKQTVGGSGVRRCQFFDAAQVLADVDRLHAALDLANRGVTVAALSQAHSYGLTVGALQTLFHGVPMHWVATPFPSVVAGAIRAHERVFLAAVPAMWKAWLLGGLPMEKVALAVSAGSPLTLALEERARVRGGIKLHNLYGASECGAISFDDSEEPRTDEADLGKLLPGVEASVGDSGRLRIRSDAVGLGYDTLLSGEAFGDGCFWTADRILVREGKLIFNGSHGRGINVAGRKLSPGEIAEKMAAGAGCPVENIAVGARVSRDPERCEEVWVKIRTNHPAVDEAFKKTACRWLAPWEVPRVWTVEPR